MKTKKRDYFFWAVITALVSLVLSSGYLYAENRLLGAEDLRWGTSTTEVSAGTLHWINASYLPFLYDNTVYLEDLVDGDGLTNAVINFTGATSLAIPASASPTVNATGKIGIDTTSDQLKYYGGGARVLSYRRQICGAIENLTDTDDAYEFYEFEKASTLLAASAHCRGTCTTPATITFQDRATNAVTLGSTLTASTGTGDSTWITVSSGGSFNAGEGIAFNVTNTPSPLTDEYTICVSYSVTAD